MRRFAPLIAVVIAAIVIGIGWNFWSSRMSQNSGGFQAKAPLSDELVATREGWEWSYTEAGRPIVEVRAKDMKSVKAPSVMELMDVEMRLFHQDGKVFDRVVSPNAMFAAGDGKLYSDAEVGITMGLSSDDSPPGRLVSIKSSGVSFEKDTGRAETDRHATFSLDVGDGEAEGASYDPQTRELRLKSKVKLIWRGKDPKSLPMHIESGELLYKEIEQKVYLSPWSRFSRSGLSMEGGATEITLEDGNIRLVDSIQAKGTEKGDARLVEFGAEQLQLLFRDKGLMEKITGQNRAYLANHSTDSKTTVRSRRLDLSFNETSGQAELVSGLAQGESTVESVPTPVNGKNAVTPPTRILRSDVIEMKMKSGGQEMERVVTHTPGVLEFLPNHATQKKRHLDAERMTMLYTSGNVLETFQGSKVKTRTEPEKASSQKASPPGNNKQPAPQFTWSDEMVASFDPKSGEMIGLEQWGKFRYEEADRRARSERAVMDQKKNLITLTGNSRVWDMTGSTDAETILISQGDGGTIARGNVRTVREPDHPDEGKIHATAKEMNTSSDNSRIQYAGDAVLWQGENRLKADTIVIQRPIQQIQADGKVINILRDSDQPITTIVRAEKMTYSDKDKVAFYEGKVNLIRPQLNVKSDRLRAYLSQEGTEEVSSTIPRSGLDRAFAEGSVEILQQDQGRTRFGKGSSADYYVGDSKVILEGDRAQMTEKQAGSDPTKTEGHKLTWYGTADKLLVDGAVAQPAVSTFRRKNKKK